MYKNEINKFIFNLIMLFLIITIMGFIIIKSGTFNLLNYFYITAPILIILVVSLFILLNTIYCYIRKKERAINFKMLKNLILTGKKYDH